MPDQPASGAPEPTAVEAMTAAAAAGALDEPAEVPDEWVLLFSSTYLAALDRDDEDALRNAIAAVAPVIRQVERAKAAAELRELRDGVTNPGKPYNEAFIHALDCAIRHITRGGTDG